MSRGEGDVGVVSRAQLEQTAKTDHGPTYRCPQCGFDYVTEYCDCPDCGWAGMCQEAFE